MPEFIFLPVPTREMREFAQMICDNRTAAQNTAPTVLKPYFEKGMGKGIVRALGRGCLRGVRAGDTLYLVLHGDGVAGSKGVGAGRGYSREDLPGRIVWKAGPGSTEKDYSPDDVARIIEAEGLTKGFIDLHMLTCGSGLEGGNDPNCVRSIAERVRDAMQARGYDRIRVTGYTGSINVGGGAGGFKVQTVSGNGSIGLLDPPQAAVVFGLRPSIRGW
jgi:hypothetical protein